MWGGHQRAVCAHRFPSLSFLKNLTTGPVAGGGVGRWAREAGGGWGGAGRSAPKGAPVASTELPYKLNNWEASEGCTRCGGLKNLWSGGWVDLG